MELLFFGEIEVVKFTSQEPEDFSGFTVNLKDAVKISVGTNEVVVFWIYNNRIKVRVV